MAGVHHRKIELQEQDDLRYLITNARRRATEKIDLALPPIEGEDALRRRVEELVHEYITTTYTTASENIVINGHPPSPTYVTSLLLLSDDDPSIPTTTSQQQSFDHHYEPLDGKLHARAAELSRREEDLLEEIAALKREVPRLAAERWREALREGIERDEKEAATATATATMNDNHATKTIVGKQHEDGGVRILEIGPPRERQRGMERTWARGVEGLGRLKDEMPATTARMERAKRAAEYVLAERRGTERRGGG